jgi:hypothetical protein
MKWKGELAALPPMIEKAVKGVHDLGVPLNLHANGDAAIDTFLKIHEKVAADDLGRDRHVTLIHAQGPPRQVRRVQDHAVVLHAAYLLLRVLGHRSRLEGARVLTRSVPAPLELRHWRRHSLHALHFPRVARSTRRAPAWLLSGWIAAQALLLAPVMPAAQAAVVVAAPGAALEATLKPLRTTHTVEGARSADTAPSAAPPDVTAVEVTIAWDRPEGSDARPVLRLPLVESNVETAALDLDVQASDARGALPLVVGLEGVDPAAARTWRASRPVEGRLQWRYRAPVHNRLATRGAAPPFELRSEAGAFSGAGLVFLLLPESSVPHRLAVRWDLSALPAGARGVSSLGVGDVVLDQPYPPVRLTRAYYMGGTVGLVPADSDGRGFFGAWMGEPPFDARELLDWTARLYGHYGNFFGDATAPRYGVFLRRNLVNPGGGVGLLDSFVGTFDTGLDVVDFKLTLAHEMFHTRSPYIVNPPGLASQWFPEGLAVFYQRVLPWRFGLVDSQAVLDDINYHAGRYFTNALGDAAYAQVPLRFWEDTRIRTIPYDRGSFYFVVVDHAVRRRSGGQRSLDDLMLELRRREQAGAKLSMADWEGVLRAELGEAAVAQFRAMLAGAWMVPESDAFGPCFRRTSARLRRYELGFEPKALTEQPRIVRGLVAGSAAVRAGLRNGDEILRPVGQDAIQGDQARELELQVRRDGRDTALRYLPRGETVDAWQWERDPAATAEACRR